MAQGGGVDKHQAELLEKYLPCSLLPWGPGRHPGLCDASWELVLPASRMQPVSDVTCPSWLKAGALFCCRLCPYPGCHLGTQQAGSEREKRQTVNVPCSPPPAPPCVHLTLLQGAPQLFLPFPAWS